MDPQKFDWFDPSTHPPKKEIEENPEKWMLCPADGIRLMALQSARCPLIYLEVFMLEDPAYMVRESAARLFSERTAIFPEDQMGRLGLIYMLGNNEEDTKFYSPDRAPKDAKPVRWGAVGGGWEEVKE